jgi:hypothetical protein
LRLCRAPRLDHLATSLGSISCSPALRPSRSNAEMGTHVVPGIGASGSFRRNGYATAHALALSRCGYPTVAYGERYTRNPAGFAAYGVSRRVIPAESGSDTQDIGIRAAWIRAARRIGYAVSSEPGAETGTGGVLSTKNARYTYRRIRGCFAEIGTFSLASSRKVYVESGHKLSFGPQQFRHRIWSGWTGSRLRTQNWVRLPDIAAYAGTQKWVRMGLFPQLRPCSQK